MIEYDSFLVDGMWLSTESDLLVITDAVMCVNYAEPGPADPRPRRGSKPAVQLDERRQGSDSDYTRRRRRNAV